MLNNNDMLMDWDDAIENDGQEFVILPEGDYNFTVTDFEQSHSDSASQYRRWYRHHQDRPHPLPLSGMANLRIFPLHRSEEAW